ncbi:hypothetical protein ACFL34_04395 [Candidatus Sumerlaeota bacterium]
MISSTGHGRIFAALLVVVLWAVAAGLPAQQSLPFASDFEAPTYSLGGLPQQGWTCDPADGASVIDSQAFAGTAALEITSGTVVNQLFSSSDSIVWLDGYRMGQSSDLLPDLSQLTSGSAILAFHSGELKCLNGNGAGGGNWLSTGIPLDSGWHRITVRLDYSAKRYDCYIDSAWIISGNRFLWDNTSNQLNGFIGSSSNGSMFVDSLNVTPYPPPISEQNLRDYLLGKIELDTLSNLEERTADANGDGVIDVSDLVFICNL